MAVRLSVVMIQTPPAGAAKQALAEQIVGEVIGLPGIDLTLVAPIKNLAESSTDRLSLEAISGDIAFLDWQSQEQSMADLEAIGFAGCRTPHANDPLQNSNHQLNPQRRIYAFDLGGFAQATQLKDALLQLRDHRQVKTLSIGLSPPPIKHSPSSPVITPGEAKQETSVNGRAAGSVASDAANSKTTAPTSNPKVASDRPTPSTTTPTTPGTANPERPTNAIDLDQLLDQLDELDP